MAYDRRQAGPGGRVALLVLDGLSLADWGRVREAWAARRPDWAMTQRGPLLAQIPTATAVSRQALVSGRRPAEFAKIIISNAAGRVAFAPEYSRVVTHGGLTLDEVVVPFVLITNDK
ncbi:MAG: PglZ domain-containing protein [Candidatus Promineofilum sp.]|nr:PglZ domain-containing protein [Promineifilum sp.]